MNLKVLGDQIRTARTSRRMSQSELALRVGVDKSLLSKVENGRYRPTSELLQGIFNALSIREGPAMRIWALSGRPGGPVTVGQYAASSSLKIRRENMAEPEKKQVGLNVSIDGSRTPVLYSDVMSATSTDMGMTLDFGQRLGPSSNVMIVARVGVSFEHAKKIAEAINNELEKNER